MSRLAYARTNARTLYAGIRPTDAEERAYVGGDPGTPGPEGQRPLTPAEKAHNDVYTWSVALGTYTCEHYPTGVPS